MLNRYFQQELDNLRELGAEFAKAHPALAPMLAGATTDPDVERLLEGVAFLTGLMREKIDDEFPEIIQSLMQIIFPHYLRPLPAATIVAFSPKPALKKTYTVPAGVSLASKPVDGTACTFRTCYPVEAHPLSMEAAYFQQQAGKPPTIQLFLSLSGSDLSKWQLKKLRFHLGKDYPTAATIYYMLMNFLERVTIAPMAGGEGIELGPAAVSPVGFEEDEAMIVYPPQSFPGYRLLQEYFILPSKFLFFDLEGFERWQNRGNGNRFKVVFEFREMPFPPPRLSAENFVLFATPAVNLFAAEADPINLDHRHNHYRVRVSGSGKVPYQVYSVDKVTGYQQGKVKANNYKPFDLFHILSSEESTYHVGFRRSASGNSLDALLSFTYPRGGAMPAPEILSISTTCTNGELAEKLQLGDITEGTTDSPELLNFKNIRPPTSSVLPPLDRFLLWRLLSLYSLNYLSLAKTDNIKALLKLYIFSESRDQASTYANTRRVDGISDLEVKSADRLVAGYMMRGQEITLKVLADHFASDGDYFLFGSVLDRFFGSYASLNSFTSFMVQEVLKGDTCRWPTRLGDRPLI